MPLHAARFHILILVLTTPTLSYNPACGRILAVPTYPYMHLVTLNKVTRSGQVMLEFNFTHYPPSHHNYWILELVVGNTPDIFTLASKTEPLQISLHHHPGHSLGWTTVRWYDDYTIHPGVPTTNHHNLILQVGSTWVRMLEVDVTDKKELARQNFSQPFKNFPNNSLCIFCSENLTCGNISFHHCAKGPSIPINTIEVIIVGLLTFLALGFVAVLAMSFKRVMLCPPSPPKPPRVVYKYEPHYRCPIPVYTVVVKGRKQVLTMWEGSVECYNVEMFEGNVEC